MTSATSGTAAARFAALDPAAIRAAAGGFDGEIVCLDTVDSTNARLLAGFGHRRALLAEFQQAGRGRRGRRWLMPRDAGLALSLGFEFPRGLAGLGALSLEAGLAVAGALADVAPVRLKWPNDLLIDGRKLGGLLVEARGAGNGRGEIVIGLGINVDLAAAAELPDQPWADLQSASGRPVCRNDLVGRLIVALDAACTRVAQGDVADLPARWARFDALAGRDVVVHNGAQSPVHGVARGVTGTGALRLLHNGAVIEIPAGEVSLRAC